VKEHPNERAKGQEQTAEANRLSSADLAALVVDALVRAGIVKGEHVGKAMRIATEEIEVRKALGDY